MQTVTRKLSELTKNERNIRRHSQRQLDEYVRSVKMFGQIRPMVIDEKGVILAGNGLYEAMVQAGMTEADCYVYEGLTPAQKDKLMLADNKVYELGITDMNLFDDIIRGLGDDLDVPGYDDELLRMINQSVKEVTEQAMEYGKIEVSQKDAESAEKERDGASLTAAQLKGENPYKNAVIPQQVTANEKSEPEPDPDPDIEHRNSNAERKFIVCPKCGERIWL